MCGASGGAGVVFSGLQAFFKSQGCGSGFQKNQRACVDCPALGGTGASESNHGGKCGGVHNMGACAKREAGQKKSGQTFRQWVKQLRELGYTVEWRNLVAADYGAPTIRKRFVCVARCDGKPIRWPEPTHAPADSPDVRKGKLLPWRSAAEIIDWDIPAYSIFATKEEIKEKYGVNAVRPLADNTLRRVIRGVEKFTIKSGKPFIVECNHGGDGHTRGTDEPVNTVTGKYTGGICEPVMVPVTFPNTSGSVGGSADQPVHTITTGGKQVFSAANLIQPYLLNMGCEDLMG